MAKRVSECGDCGAKFDVSRMDRAAFDCPKCGAAIALGEEQKLPSAMRARASGREPTKSEPKPEKKARTPRGSRPRSTRPASTKRPNVALYAGAAAALALGIGAAVILSGDDAPTPTSPPVDDPQVSAAPPSGTRGTAALANLEDEWGAYLKLSERDRHAHLATRIEQAAGGLPALEALAVWLSDPKLAQDGPATQARERIGHQALEQDPSLAWAHEAIGERDVAQLLRACFAACELAFNHGDAREIRIEKLLEGLEEGPHWVPAALAAELAADVAAIRTRNAELAANPRLLDVERVRDWVRHNPLFDGIRERIEYRYVEPYVLFQEYALFLDEDGNPDPLRAKDNARRRAHADALVRREGILLTEMHRRFREMFAERHELPELADHGRLLKAFFLWDRATFDKWHEDQGSAMAGFVRAYYSPTEKRIVSYVGGDALRSQDELWSAGGFVQKQFDQVTIHEGLHQVFDEYAAILQGHPLRDDEATVTPRKSMWLSEGLAELMGAVEYERDKRDTLDGVTWRHARIHLGRVELAKRHRAEGGPMWSLSDLVEPNHNGDLLARSRELYPQDPVQMANVFYARSWAFVHFLWFYDDGKYRERFQDYVGMEFLDQHGTEALAQAFGLESTDDWGEIEQEFDWYWDACLGIRVGRKVNRTTQEVVGWWEPDTSAPTGRFDPHAEDEDYDADDGNSEDTGDEDE